jgi:hypothetical protein
MVELRFDFATDEPHDEPAVTLDSFLGQSNATAVRIESGEDARADCPSRSPRAGRGQLPQVPRRPRLFLGRMLREAGYTGELRAQGDVLVDQIPLMRRCGFDSFAPEAPIDDGGAERSLARYDHVYQAPPMRPCRCGSSGMAELARKIDRIDTARASPRSEAIRLNNMFRGVGTARCCASCSASICSAMSLWSRRSAPNPQCCCTWSPRSIRTFR